MHSLRIAKVFGCLSALWMGLLPADVAGAASVKDYGARGTGTIDDTAPIQNAINSCFSGGSILFPAGTYKLSGTVYLKSNCSYTGEGFPVLLGYQGTGTGGYQLFELDGNKGSAKNMTITGLIFDGGGVFLQEASGDFAHTINNITIRNNIFRNLINSRVVFGGFQFGILADGGTLSNSSIDHNFFSHLADADRVDNGYPGSLSQDSFKYGVQIRSAAHTSINNNVFDWIAGDGIHVGRLEQHVNHPGLNIQNNIFTRVHRNMIEIQLWDAVSTIISGNLGGHIMWGYWNTGGMSFASSGQVLSQNNVWDGFNDLDGADSFPNHNPNGNGYCEEIWGVNSIVDHVRCQSAPGTARGYSVFADGVGAGHTQWLVPGTHSPFTQNITIQNSTYCGEFAWGYLAYEDISPPFPKVTQINVSAPVGCSAFPTIPHNLTATVASASTVKLSWTAATDSNGIRSYNVYRDGEKIATVSGTSYQDTGVRGGNVYWYNVQASDTLGHSGAASLPAVVTTPASTGGGSHKLSYTRYRCCG
jgi:hypothetical protein